MAANTAPIFPVAPRTSWIAAMTAASTAKDGTGATLLYTAGSNGSLVDYIRVRALGSNVATVMRVFVNNGSSSAVAANNTLLTEQTIDLTTLSEVAALAETTITINLGLPAGYRLYVAIGTAVAAGLQATAIGGDY